MASIEKRNGKWRARYRTPDGASRCQTFDKKVDAERFLTSVEHRKLTGEYVDPGAGKVTLQTYAEQWRTSQVQHRPNTAALVEGHLRRHVYPSLGQRPLGSLRPSEVQAWVKDRAEHLAPSTVALVYSYLRSITRAAVDDRVISRDPCVRIKLPRVELSRVVPLEVEQIERLVSEMPARFRGLVVLASGTGMRQGECFGLTVDRVDFLRRTIRVDRQLVMLTGQPWQLGPPKTAASVRTIPLPQVVADALAAHLAAFPAGEDGLIFTNEDGAPIRRSAFGSVWRPAVERSKLASGSRFHDLRHFYASLLIRHGESVKVVQERLGHASAKETLDTYSHLWPDSEDRTRAAVDAVLGASRVPGVSRSAVS